MTREVHPRILIVEDEKDIVQVLEFALRQAGFDPVAARDANDAFARIREKTPDAVLLDLDAARGCRARRSAGSSSPIPAPPRCR